MISGMGSHGRPWEPEYTDLRAVRSRTQGVVGAGGYRLPATRLGKIILNDQLR